MTYILQKRDQHGMIRTVERSKDPIDQKNVEKDHGPGWYCMKETSPRFRLVWKAWIGPIRGDETQKLSKEIQALEKKTTYLAWAEAILGIGEVVGFGLTASNLINHSQD